MADMIDRNFDRVAGMSLLNVRARPCNPEYDIDGHGYQTVGIHQGLAGSAEA